MHFPKLAAIAAVALLSIAACGGGAPAPTGAAATNAPSGTTSPTAAPPVGATSPPIGGTVDVCSLLTPAELNAATGRDDYAAGRLDSAGQCLWNTEGTTVNEGDLIAGYINPDVTLDFIKSSFGAGGSDATVNGLAAFWNPSAFLASMWVDIGGGRVFVLSFPSSSDLAPSYTQLAQQLAEIAVGRI